MMAGAGASPYELASDAASRLGIAVGAEELATLASDLDLGDGEMAAVAATFSYLAEKRRLASIETLLRLSRLPRREPKTFDGYDWSAVSWPEGMGRESLLALDFVERREDLVLMGDVGTGKTHMASAPCALACERRLEACFFTVFRQVKIDKYVCRISTPSC